MISELCGFYKLVETLEELAIKNKDGSPYCSGKCVAYASAARWLKEEIEIYEKKSR